MDSSYHRTTRWNLSQRRIYRMCQPLSFNGTYRAMSTE